MRDFTRENGFNLTSVDDQDRAGMSYWGMTANDTVIFYQGPSAELQRIFKLSSLSDTGPLKPSSPCPSAKACSYSMDIAAPAYNCQERLDFGGKTHPANNRSQLSPTGLLYMAYSSVDDNEDGVPIAWDNISSSAQDIGVFTEVPSLWVGWLTESDEHHSHVVECLLYNAIISLDMTFSGDDVSINHTAVNLISPLLPEGSSKSPLDTDYQQFS